MSGPSNPTALVDGRPELAGEAGVARGHEGVGGDPAGGGAGVVAGQRVDDDGVHGLAVQAARHGVGQLDLAALAGLLAGEELHHERAQQVTAHDVEVGGGRLGARLLDQAADAPHGARLGLPRALVSLERADEVAGDDAVAVHLVGLARGDGDHGRAAVGAGDLEHLVADVLGGHHVVAQQDQEGLAGAGVGGGADGVAQALGLVLVAEVHGHVAGVGDGVGVAGLAALAQQGLQRAVGLEVAQQLGLAGARHDDGGVDLLRVEGLLHHVLDDRLVEDRQHLLGGALGGGQKAGAEAGGGDDSLHDFHSLLHSSDGKM